MEDVCGNVMVMMDKELAEGNAGTVKWIQDAVHWRMEKEGD